MRPLTLRSNNPDRAGFFTGVGTVLFNMVVESVSGTVYVSNTDAQNDHRFEGPGTYAGHSLRAIWWRATSPCLVAARSCRVT